ncbi:MAG: PEP-CTERM sorting domain-containing protein, partial [Gammaproteobacteria bacterium]|nr:PEP-CTERM sorting domain-containing protein [Gammaproteobacteria bacterium]
MDANYAQTSGFDSDGKMNWNASVAFADNLVHMGYDDWRLPKSLQPDPGCGGQKINESFGYGCTGSEMGSLFYNDLDGIAGSSVLLSGDPDLGLFTNLKSNSYWTGTIGISSSNIAWDFDFNDGAQHNNGFDFEFYSLIVRDGDVVIEPVPEPSTIAMMGLGIGSLLIFVWLKRRLR